MGEVYRARDTRLGRDVAIKVLPTRSRTIRIASRASSAKRRLLASLNHPHIARDLRTRGQRRRPRAGAGARRRRRRSPIACASGPLPTRTKRCAIARADRRRARSRAREGHRPSRSQAGEHQGARPTARSRCSTSAWPRRSTGRPTPRRRRRLADADVARRRRPA